MSQAADAPSLWIGLDGPGAARERLRKAVAGLTRARHLQILVDHAFGGLLAGLCLATIAVLAVRQASSSYPTWPLAGLAVIVAVAAALVLGWWRRPDPLDVAIRADLMLRLKQRLSTAWELRSVHGDDELADRLAVQAVRAGIPARAGTVFPLRINRAGWLAPLAAAALLLVSVVDLSGVQPPAHRQVDEQVVGEGQRLGAFGREMQARAQRDKLPRSTRQADRLERLGAHMESGALSRDQALGQLGRMGESLDQERTQALGEANGGERGGQRTPNAQRSAIGSDLNPGAMLERMQRGALDRSDTAALAQRLDQLARAGVPRKEMQSALEQHEAGADQALEEILEKLARWERALKEDKELSNALEQVRRSQDNLGSPRASSEGPNSASAAIDWDEDERADRDASSAAGARTESRTDSSSSARSARGGSHANSSLAGARAETPLRQEVDAAGRVLRPEGQLREGREFTTQGRMLPRANRPSVEQVEMGSEFAAQAEAVLSREQFPEHYKDFVRRYFLNLSQGARVSPQQQPPAREAQR
ncbi:MAG: hypothetical protein GEV05_11255 [Betaproteobacteria bacterium]|nr:hypothetical protein [Betaproteobacteria bacterium]